MALPVFCLAAYHLGTLAADGIRISNSATPILTVNGLHIDPELLDLGEIWESPRHTVRLQIKNLSSASRTVSAFEPSCDCLDVEPAGLTLAPGQAGDVSVQVDLTYRLPYHLGLARRPVAVHLRPKFEGDFAPSQGWTLTGVVRSRMTLDAHHLAFGDRCVQSGSVSRKVRAKAHVPLRRLEAVAVPDRAAVRVEEVGGSPGDYVIVVTPRPDLPVGPFRFDVQVQAVDAEGVPHRCASINVTGEMQPAFRVWPRVVLLGEHPVPGKAEAEIVVSLPDAGWTIARVETDSLDTSVTREKAASEGEIRLGVTQKVAKAGDQVSPVRIVVRKPTGENEAVTVEVRYHGQDSRR